MAKELVQLCNAKGKPLGIMERKEAHRKRKLHVQVRVLLFNKKGDVFVQQRSEFKDADPFLWEGSVSGHVGPGEDLLKAVQREVREELGISIPLLRFKKVGSAVVTETSEKNHMTFFAVFNVRHTPRTDPNEVVQGHWENPCWITKDTRKNPKKYTAGFKKAWEFFK